MFRFMGPYYGKLLRVDWDLTWHREMIKRYFFGLRHKSVEGSSTKRGIHCAIAIILHVF